MLDVPERPKNLKPDEVRAEHIKMSWQRPDDDGGSPITGYVLRMMDLEAGNWITIDEVSFKPAGRITKSRMMPPWAMWISNFNIQSGAAYRSQDFVTVFLGELRGFAWAVGSYSSSQSDKGTSQKIIYKTL